MSFPNCNILVISKYLAWIWNCVSGISYANILLFSLNCSKKMLCVSTINSFINKKQDVIYLNNINSIFCSIILHLLCHIELVAIRFVYTRINRISFMFSENIGLNIFVKTTCSLLVNLDNYNNIRIDHYHCYDSFNEIQIPNHVTIIVFCVMKDP